MPGRGAQAGGGFAAIRYVFAKAHQAGGLWRLWQRLRSKNTCKTCALGMGGQRGGMVDEAGHFPAVCKKSVQAVAGDMARAIDASILRHTSLDEFGRMSPAQLERLGRIPFPLLAEPDDSHYRRISWDEALRRCGDAFSRARPEQTFFYASGRSSNEAAFLLQLVARAYGTAHVNNCSYYCHQASGVALNQVYGSGTASVTLDDMARADLALVVGANPASNHPRLITQLIHLRRRGGKVIIINPLREVGLVRFHLPSDARSLLFGSQISDLYLQPHVGSDIAVFKALLKGVIEAGAVDAEFVAQATSGWDELRRDIEASPWDELLPRCGLSHGEIQSTVGMLAEGRRGIFLWAMGLTHHAHGVDNILSLANLALARGWLGRPGCGLLPIRGHSNVQGVGSVGVVPQLKAAFAGKMEEIYGIVDPPGGGMDTYACMQAATEGRVDAAFLLGGNLHGASPDLRWAERALGRIPFTVQVSTKLNTGHFRGRGRTNVILPVLTRDEETQSTTQESMFNFVRLSDGGEATVEAELRSEVELIAALAERILPPDRFDWSELRSHDHLRRRIAEIVPDYGPIGDIAHTKREFQIPGRTFHEARFDTKDGRAHFHVTPLQCLEPAIGEFRLMTLRSEGQFNSVVYEEEDYYRGNAPRDAVLMSETDAQRYGWTQGQRVVVETEVGRMDAAVHLADIAPGNLAMYYPEANVLVPRRMDPRSRTPAFKSIVARVEGAPRRIRVLDAIPTTQVRTAEG